MKGIKNYKGSNVIAEIKLTRSNDIRKDYEIVEDLKLLIQELTNFYHIYSGECFWDIEHGLNKRIIFSRNKSAIKSEIRNKTLKYYGDRVKNMYEMNVEIEDSNTLFTAKISTIYGEVEIGGELKNADRN